jgi:hypothetical protein
MMTLLAKEATTGVRCSVDLARPGAPALDRKAVDQLLADAIDAGANPRLDQVEHRSDGGIKIALFGVALDSLPLSVAIETVGGVSATLIPRGTRLPAPHAKVFSTAIDDQPSVAVHALLGERPLARDNHSLGNFQLTGIPPARAAAPLRDVDGYELCPGDGVAVLARAATTRA